MYSFRSAWYLLFGIFPVLTLAAPSTRQMNVTGGPRGPHPYLFKGVSQKALIETARDHQWAINFQKNGKDTIHIVALRVEFNGGQKDSSSLTTGNGLFGIRGGGDKEESGYYNSDTVYTFDSHPHDSLYFARQLQSVASYFRKVSRGKLSLEFSIYPEQRGEIGYSVPMPMTHYSPGGKKRSESWDDYYNRKTYGLMSFVKDAITYSDKASDSPFSRLRFEASDSTIRDEQNRKTVFLIFHAGASYLTDGGEQGALGQDSPSDMIDAFINSEFFSYYRDTLELKHNGIMVQGKTPFLINEIMMCSETSNQDGLNWGIQGILVNQIARQLGIPDLFSTSSGISGVGAFCIMDFAGYSAGKGFIPPYPSAWVRAFMGWDEVRTVPIASNKASRVKALTSVLDGGALKEDTTILMVPLNDHEYYLIENRQRNLSTNKNLFKYDTTDEYGVVIASYPYNIDIDSNVLVTSGADESNVILEVRNNDVSLPASGVLVWHVDERIIRERLTYNMLNADSSYRGVSLVEADGITDLGVMFRDVFYQAAFDYGGAEDVFPHETQIEKGSPQVVNSFGPYTRPSTRSNDGGHTYLKMQITPASSSYKKEYTLLARGSKYHKIANYSDSVFTVSTSWDYLVPSWPRRAEPGEFYDPVLCDLDRSRAGKELILVSASGRIYAWSSDTSLTSGYNSRQLAIDRINLLGDTLRQADTVLFLDSIPFIVSMPSAIAGAVYIPSGNKRIYVLRSLSETVGHTLDSIFLSAVPSTYLCQYQDSSWALGCEKGRLVFGKGLDTVSTIRLKSDSSVCAVAAIGENQSIAVIQMDGTLSLCKAGENKPDTSIKVPGIGPYTLVTGDLDRDNSSEIIVCDSRHGIWVYKQTMSLAPGWEKDPSDWPSAYSYTEENKTDNRSRFPINLSPPALADINKDGYLDILVSGTNGLYAFNYKGVLIGGWPAYLDTRYWYQRGSVVSSPVIVTGKNRDPLILFSSVTGERPTFTLTKVVKADRNKGKVWYRTEKGALDSIWDLSGAQVDTILNLNDSLVAPYVLPGGFIDAVTSSAVRPSEMIDSHLQSKWPLTTGSSLTTSPYIGFMDNDNVPDLFAVSTGGWVYRWEIDKKDLLPDSLFWPMVGYDAGRSFTYGGGMLPILVNEKEPIRFYNYPNPTNKSKKAVFRYAFSGPASKVRLDIFSQTGFRVYSKTTMGNPPQELTGSYPDWNEHVISLDKFGPAVYRCRLEATIDGKKHVRYWKMAVVK